MGFCSIKLDQNPSEERSPFNDPMTIPRFINNRINGLIIGKL